jgi:hypothetical protein
MLLMLLPALVCAQSPVTHGPGTDYQPSILRAADSSLVLVLERLDGSLSGDLYLTRSLDNGDSWTSPTVIVTSAANERHPALVQLGDGSYVLFYLKGTGAASSFRLLRATSADGVNFIEQGQLQLGWASGGEVNPHVIRHPDGTLTLTYHRLSGSSYVAQSSDNGATWDQLRTAIAAGTSQLPRIAYRPGDGRYLVTYQVGSSPLALYAKTSIDVRDWSAPAIDFAISGDNHDSLPVLMPDDSFVVFYIRAIGGQYDIYSRRSPDGVNFDNPRALIESSDATDVQPHPLIGPDPDRAQLYWGRGSPPGSTAYQIYRKADVVVRDGMFRDGFE